MNEKKTFNPTEPGIELPRLLIIGQTFTTDTGGGITLASLFKDWPRDQLAIAVESKEGIDFKRCANYYRMGYQELRMPFPFCLFQRKTRSGPLSETAATGALTVAPASPVKKRAKRMFDLWMHRLGIFYWLYGNEKLSEPLARWMGTFRPEVIYYQPNSFKSLDLVQAVRERFQVPLITHVMDDWFPVAVPASLLQSFWQKRLDEKVRRLFAASQLHLSICNYMSKEYAARYGHTFFPFHNAVNLQFWGMGGAGIKPLHEPARILYAGRLGSGVDDTLLKMAGIIEKMGAGANPILLEVQTRDQDHPLVSTLKQFRQVRVSGPIPYAELPAKFYAADILLIPCEFRGPGLKFIRFSMPTKVSEYMATGTPVLVVGPSDTALVEYAKEGWARVCTSDHESEIKAAITELLASADLRMQLVETARCLALRNHEEQQVAAQFRQKVMILKKLGLAAN